MSLWLRPHPVMPALRAAQITVASPSWTVKSTDWSPAHKRVQYFWLPVPPARMKYTTSPSLFLSFTAS